jgi:putative inorganic carbon (HCO3(-)) transporter
MNSAWAKITLSNLPLYQWRSASYLYNLVGCLATWRKGSWLMQWGEALGALLVSLVFAFAPFVSNDLVGVLLLACGGFWLLLTLADDGDAGVTPIHLLVLLYWGISAVATAMSPVKMAALAGLIKLTLYMLFFALSCRVLRRQSLRSGIITVYLLVALIVSVYGLRQWIFGAEQLATWVDANSSLAKTTRVYSYLGNPNLLAAYLVPAIAFSLSAIFAWRGWICKALAVVMFGVNSLCLVLTFSRGGWIGLMVMFFTFLLLLFYWFSVYLPAFWRTWTLPILLGGVASFMVLALLFVEPVRDRIFSMFIGRQDSSNNFRLNVWAAVREMIADRPVLGIGPGNNAFNKIYPLYMRPRYTALSAYSVILEVMVETGFIGLMSFLWLLLVTLNSGWQQLRRLRELGNQQAFWLIAAIATLLGMLAHGAFDTVLYRPEVNTLWWFMIALIASYYTNLKQVARD